MSENWRPMLYSALEIMLAAGITVTCSYGGKCEFYTKLIGFPVPVANFRKLVT